MWPKVLITPQTVPSRPRNGAPLTAMASRIRPDSSLSDSCATVFSRERFTCSMPLSETNRLRPLPSGILEARVQLQAAGLVDHEQRAALGLHPAVKDIEHVLLGAVFVVEEMVELLGAAHLHRFGDHDRPGDDGEDDEAEDDGLAFGRGLPPHIKQFRLIRPAAAAAKKMGTFIPTRSDYDSANLVVRNRSAQAELVQKKADPNSSAKTIETLLAVSSKKAKTKFTKV